MISDRDLYNMSSKQLKQYTLIQKLHIFYSEKKIKEIEKDIKNGKLILRKDFEETQAELLEFTINKVKNNITSETQLEELTSKNEEQIRKQLNRQLLASFLEIAYLDLNKEFKMSTRSFQTVFEE